MLGTSNSRRLSVIPKGNYLIYGLFLMFIIGMIYGALLSKTQSAEFLESLNLITREYASAHEKQTLLKTLSSSFLSCSIFVVTPYLLGYSAIGQVASFFVPMFKGLGIGLTMGHLYLSYGLKGVSYSALIIVPQTVVGLFAILIGCREAIRLSSMFLGVCSSSKQGKPFSSETIRLYNIKFSVLLAIALFSAVVDVITVLLFSRMFNFN